jgi:hypothetical protein
LPPLPASFAATRASLRALACYVIAPARKAATGRIGLVATKGGFGTPPFGEQGTTVTVHDDRLVREPGGEARITTVRAGAAFVEVPLQADPGVGHDLPPFEPDRPLPVDATASRVLGEWYAFGTAVLAQLRDRYGDRADISSSQLWPEHFDIAATAGFDGGHGVTVGCSPGDATFAEPYVYVSPWEPEARHGPFWNAPFGAVLEYPALLASADPYALADRFCGQAFEELGARGPIR